jgi:hypothetical protein
VVTLRNTMFNLKVSVLPIECSFVSFMDLRKNQRVFPFTA